MASIKPKSEDATQKAIENLLNPSQKPSDLKHAIEKYVKLQAECSAFVSQLFPDVIHTLNPELFINNLAALKALGWLPGLPNNLFFKSLTLASKHYHGLAIELKPPGMLNTTSIPKADTGRKLKAAGWYVVQVDTFRDFSTIVRTCYAK